VLLNPLVEFGRQISHNKLGFFQVIVALAPCVSFELYGF
jgi:hypothetical protein